MAFVFDKPSLYLYDVFPKVVVCGRETDITIRPLGSRRFYRPGSTYTLTIKAINGGKPVYYPLEADYTDIEVTCSADGALRFRHSFSEEQEYFLDIAFKDDRGRDQKERYSVYCVAEDLDGLYPFIGDLHIHTNRSDGTQDPAVMCANCRRHGYDFMAVTDHRRYYPSLEAMSVFADVQTELTIVPGEEVHIPPVDGEYIEPHIVNFGGEYSVNALVERDDVPDVPQGDSGRSLYGQCPPVMSKESFAEKLREVRSGMDIPEGLEPTALAGVKWVFDEIRRANGLAIYVHPTWISDAFHVPEKMQDYIVQSRMFDAFEVLGGENYFEQNGYQTIRYYEDKAKGYRYPVVGSTDSHNSLPYNRNAFICSTIVFSAENERKALIDSVKAFRSVAVDTISTEFRVVGESRLARYACFLLKNYFPIHDDACIEEGRMLMQYAVGNEEEKQDAKAMLELMHGRIAKMRKKYFAFSNEN